MNIHLSDSPARIWASWEQGRGSLTVVSRAHSHQVWEVEDGLSMFVEWMLEGEGAMWEYTWG